MNLNVSVLICTYNSGNYLKETIKSVLNQTYSNFELLILDNNSSDKTVENIKSFDDKRITLFESEKNYGPYGGLNFLLDHARGEYIAIQDHDDLWHPDKLQQQVDFLESKTGKQYIGCGTKTLMRYEGDHKGFEYFLGKEHYYTIHPSLVFRNQGQRYLIGSIYMNDALFQKTVLCKGVKKIYNIDETLTFHRIKDGASNFSYKWFRYSRLTIRTIFTLHPVWYGICIFGFEICRKIFYPLLRLIGKGQWIDAIERFPFMILGRKMKRYSAQKIMDMGF